MSRANPRPFPDLVPDQTINKLRYLRRFSFHLHPQLEKAIHSSKVQLYLRYTLTFEVAAYIISYGCLTQLAPILIINLLAGSTTAPKCLNLPRQ